MSRCRAIVVSLLLMSVAACSSEPSSPVTPTATPPPPGPSASVVIPMGATTLGTRAFAPEVTDIVVDTTVTWTNSDVVAHTTTATATAWNSGNVAPGGRFSFTFRSAGTFPYHCTLHPGMVGTVVVR